MSNFDYTTVEQQIKKLKGQHLIIDDEHKAKIALQTYGYYNIINGYRDPYIVRLYGKKTYSAGVTFGQIFSLFGLDHIIRNAVMNSMVDLEEHLRAVAADIIGESFGSNHDMYLSKNNYRDRKVNNPNFSREKILSNLTKLAYNSHKEPIKYYRETHHIIPPWILLKGTDFATLVNYIRLFKGPQRDKLIKMLYGNRVTEQSKEKFKDLLSDTLSMCLEYRNLAAHGGRIYNYIPVSNIRNLNSDFPSAGLGALEHCLSLFQYSQPHLLLSNSINEAVSSYCSHYPNDIHRLETAIGLEIVVQEYLWFNEKTGIYHQNQTCSGSMNNKRILLTEIDIPNSKFCKKCCNSDIISNT